MVIFHSYVSLPEGSPNVIKPTTGMVESKHKIVDTLGNSEMVTMAAWVYHKKMWLWWTSDAS